MSRKKKTCINEQKQTKKKKDTLSIQKSTLMQEVLAEPRIDGMITWNDHIINMKYEYPMTM